LNGILNIAVQLRLNGHSYIIVQLRFDESALANLSRFHI